MPRTLSSFTKIALSTAGLLLIALGCNSRKKSAPLDLTPAPAAPLASAARGSPASPFVSASDTPLASAVPSGSAEPLLPTDIPPLSPGARTEDERNTIAIFRAASRSTVFVTEKQVVIDYFRGEQREGTGTGTGFVWDRDGHIVTNFHVVKDASELAVTLQDHRSFEASVVGVEPRKDIAVLQIKAPRDTLVPIQLPPEKARQLDVGQKAIAIGNPFGLDQTLTTGVVSAIGREVQGIGGVSIRDMVQTDASINPGNSGGPLLDSSGHLIGMNTMIFSRSGSSAGIGFAVPVSSIARVVPQIIRTGHAEQVGLGVQIDPEARLERRASIAGVIVLNIIPDSPAARAGMKGIRQNFEGITLGDVIVAIDGERVESYDDLYNTLDKHKVGDTVQVTVVRDRKAMKVAIPLVALP